MPGIFASGDCVSGPSTVIKAIEAGKVAAANIDSYLGGAHQITVDVKIPQASMKIKKAWGRVVCRERESFERKQDFELLEMPLSDDEATQECARCLRCDHYGLGILKDGRMVKW
jgi:pyruvate/2-oxoglutarate dehydrogenase complex dihydrolipoamide dehydrogenase (E3) component